MVQFNFSALLTIVLPFKSPFKCIYAFILNNVLYRILENFQGTKFLRMGHFEAFHNKFSRMTICDRARKKDQVGTNHT